MAWLGPSSMSRLAVLKDIVRVIVTVAADKRALTDEELAQVQEARLVIDRLEWHGRERNGE
jgi:hypothetical protein